MLRPTPALVTEHCARRLPRWVPWLLILAYILPGFVGRDPWRTDDLAAFAVMIDMNHGGPWLTPQVLGEPAKPMAWLPYWLGALAMAVLPLPAELAARVPFMVLLGLTLSSTWYATYRLALQPAAQPLNLAFGGEARPADYARALGDGALLALVATLGLARLSHEVTPAAAQLAFAAVLFYAVVLGLPSPQAATMRSRAQALLLWWSGVWGLALSGSLWLMLAFSIAGLLWWWRSGYNAVLSRLAALGSVLAAVTHYLLTTMAQPVTLDRSLIDWASRWQIWSTVAGWLSFGRLLAWFLWPAAAFALWTLWRWRGRWRESHIGWPATIVALVLLATLLDGGNDRTLLLALPALACLAAFALPTLRRGVNALIDWFAVLFCTAAAAIIWIIWLAMQTGVPPKPAANVARLVPGFEPTLQWTLLLPAVAATAAWLGLVAWRLGRHAPALWKGLVLSASGLTLNWLLLMTLWLPLLNYGMGLAPVSRRVAALVPAGGCVLVHGLDAARIAGLQHHGGLRVRRLQQVGAQDCTVLVTTADHFPDLAGRLDLSTWQLRTEVPRMRENREKWLVLERR